MYNCVSLSEVSKRWRHLETGEIYNYGHTDSQFDVASNSSQWGTVQVHNIERQNQLRQQQQAQSQQPQQVRHMNGVIETATDYLVPTSVINFGGAGYNGAPIQERLEDGTLVNVIPKYPQQPQQQMPYGYDVQQPMMVYVTPDQNEQQPVQEQPKQNEEEELIPKVVQYDRQNKRYSAPHLTEQQIQDEAVEEKTYTMSEVKQQLAEKYKGVKDTFFENNSLPANNMIKTPFGNAWQTTQVDPYLVINVYNVVIAKYQECFYNKMTRMEDIAQEPSIVELAKQLGLRDTVNQIIYPLLTIYQNRCYYRQELEDGIITEDELNSYLHEILKATPQAFNPFRERTMLNQMAYTYNNVKRQVANRQPEFTKNKVAYKKPLDSVTSALGLKAFASMPNQPNIPNNMTPQAAAANAQKNDAIRQAVLGTNQDYANPDNELDFEEVYKKASPADRGILEAKMKRLGMDFEPGNLRTTTVNDTGLDMSEEQAIPSTYVPPVEEQHRIAQDIINNMDNELHDYDLEDQDDDLDPLEQEALKQKLTQEAIARLPEGTRLTPVVLNQIDKDVTKQMVEMGKFKVMNQFADNQCVTPEGVIPPEALSQLDTGEEPENSYLLQKYHIDEGFWAAADLQCKELHKCLHNQKTGIMDYKENLAQILYVCYEVGVPFYDMNGCEKPASTIILEYFSDLVKAGYLEELPPMPYVSGGVAEYINDATLRELGLPTQSAYTSDAYSMEYITGNGTQVNNISNNIMNAMPTQQPMYGMQQPMVNNFYNPMMPQYPPMGNMMPMYNGYGMQPMVNIPMMPYQPMGMQQPMQQMPSVPELMARSKAMFGNPYEDFKKHPERYADVPKAANGLPDPCALAERNARMVLNTTPYVMPNYMGGFRAPMPPYYNPYNPYMQQPMMPMFNPMMNSGYGRDMLSILISAESQLNRNNMASQNSFTQKLMRNAMELEGIDNEEINRRLKPTQPIYGLNIPKQHKPLDEKARRKREMLLSQFDIWIQAKTEEAYRQYKASRNEPMPVLVPSVSRDFAAYVNYVNEPGIGYNEFANRLAEVKHAEMLSSIRRKAKYEGSQTFMNKKHINNNFRMGYNPIYADNMAAMSMVNKPFPTTLDPYKQYADPRSDEEIKKVIYSDASEYSNCLRSTIPDDQKLVNAINNAEQEQSEAVDRISTDSEDNKPYEEEQPKSEEPKEVETKKPIMDNTESLKCLRRFGLNINEYEDFDNKTFDSLRGPRVCDVIDPESMELIRKAVKSPSPQKKLKMVKDIITERCPRLRYFNRGTNRFAFIDILDDSYIFKIGHTMEGENATKNEFATQDILKPFCTRIFDISEDGIFSTCERVQRYEKDAYAERFDEIKYVLQEVMSRCVVDDAGLLTFNNWGIREGFGPVILDYARCYRLVDKYVRCNHKKSNGEYCDGIMQFDTTFSYFRCPKCGQTCHISMARGLQQIEYHSLHNKFLDYSISKAMTDIKHLDLHIKVVKGDEVLYDTEEAKKKKEVSNSKRIKKPVEIDMSQY